MEAREAKIRPSQYAEFAEFVKQHSSPDRPAILMGDFNTVGDPAQLADSQSAYHVMTGGFRNARPESQFSDLWTSYGKGPGGTLRPAPATLLPNENAHFFGFTEWSFRTGKPEFETT
jgi:hypothetical protein